MKTICFLIIKEEFLKKIIIYSISILIGAILISCSGSSNSAKSGEDSVSEKEKKNKASEHFINASIYEMKNDFDNAILEYQRALDLDPSPGIHQALAKNFLLKEKPIPALKHARSAVTFDPNNSESLKLLAQVYSELNLSDSAAVIYEKIIAKDSSDVTSYFNLALLNEQKRPLKALELLNKALALTGPEWTLLYKIAEISDRVGKINETVQTMESLYKLNPGNIDLLKVLLQVYFKAENYASIDTFLSEALLLYPDDIDFIEYKAKMNIKDKKWTEAAVEYKKLIKNKELDFNTKVAICTAFVNQLEQDSTLSGSVKDLLISADEDSSYWQIKYFLGAIYSREKNDSLAIRYYEQASDLAGWNVELWIRYGGLLFDSGKYEQAVSKITGVIDRYPEDFYLNLILGLSYTQLNNYQKAEDYLEKSLKINKTDVGALIALGFNQEKLNKKKEAISNLEKALVLEPQNVQALGNLGLIYENNKEFVKSDSLYLEALKVDSVNAMILNNYAYSLAERNQNLALALKMSKKAVALEPDSPSYLDTLGWIYFMMGKYKDAEKYIKKAYDKGNREVTILEHLGDVYFKLNKKKEAIKYWEMASEKDPENSKLKEKINKGEL